MLITLDGPAAAGKGTLSRKLAEHYNLARLDTGLIYRAVGIKAHKIGNPSDEHIAIKAAQSILPNDLDLQGLRTEFAGVAASKVAAIPKVREILIIFQRNFANSPPDDKSGSIIEGRDIGTVICPEAQHKLFITASTEVRTERRYKELQDRGEEVIRSAIMRDIIDRDTRDKSRAIAPLTPAGDAKVIDTSNLNADEVFAEALNYITLGISNTKKLDGQR
jgi:cytidylate kinase